ncbi:hypothetical protein ES706_00207 [subsurface metagenome]|nr:hypothetical protein [Hadesarchaea archaeon]
MKSFRPSVNEAREFLEISSDFGNPKEIIREAVSNSFDAKATEIRISAVIDKSTGEDELVITIADNGEGMTEELLRDFFGLGFTNRVKTDAYGNKISDAIGEKGHGTKIYFNSRCIEVATVRDGKRINATLDYPKKKLRKGEVPEVKYEITPTSDKSGTTVTIRGYNDNFSAKFSHKELKDYLYWFTKFGSFELEVDVTKHKDITVRLAGLGWENSEGELLKFGCPFPPVATDIRTLRSIDKVSPLDHYVARWVFPNEPVIGMPSAQIDFVFYIEGDKAKRAYNKMIHEPRAWRQHGEYSVQDRYGLWICKDYLPIERHNDWVAERMEWTKYHAFVNCQEFRLTANRGDLGNTPPRTMEAVEKTVRGIFDTRIKPSPEFQKYQEELESQQWIQDVEKAAQREETDFQRRRDSALRKKVAKMGTIELFEPRQESGVFSLILQLLALTPDLFDFKVIDYDTSMGYDLLVTRDYALDLERAAMQFVEMKYELKRDFNHSFKKLAAVICWDTKLANDEEVEDITGAERTMKITPPRGDEDSYTKYMLVSETEPHNIEVIVLKDFLRERLKLEFRPRTKT